MAGLSLKKLEELKPRIAERYERYGKSRRDEEARQTADAKSKVLSMPDPNEFLDPALAGRAQPLAAAEHKDLAVKLAQKELRRRATKKYGPANEFRPSSGMRLEHRLDFGGGPKDLARSDEGADEADDLFRRMQDLRYNISGQRSQPKVGSGQSSEHPRTVPIQSATKDPWTNYQYPVIPPKTIAGEDYSLPPPVPPRVPVKDPVISFPSSPPPLPPRAPPPVPAKIRENRLLLDELPILHPPPIPEKILYHPATPESEFVVDSRETPSPALNSSTFTFKPSSYLENGTPLRTIFISPDLRKDFLEIAVPNTARNLETCGILCGTLISNAFFISRLVVPEQESTSDTCEMVNEAAIFEYCDTEDLMVLGWIHTHPSQTCFMSSRDLHTHSGFQAMLPESIAIVCAPSKDPDWGVFRLTDPPGLRSVLTCTQSGIFHPHAETNIYTDALRPGHVFEAVGMPFETADLRPGKGG